MENYDLGKIPPQALELEELVLGTLLTEPNSLNKVKNILSADVFYKPIHQIIFSAILTLSNENKPIDIFTVQEQLKQMGKLEEVGGRYQIALLSSAYSSYNFDFHVKIIVQKYLARKILSICYETEKLIFSEQDVFDVINFLSQSQNSLQKEVTDEAIPMNELLIDYFENYKKISQNKDKGISNAIKTGMYHLDKNLNGGFENGQLIIIGGRPSMGKTTFALKFAKEAAKAGYKTLFVSLEMTNNQLISRLIAENEGIDFYNLKNANLNREEFKEFQKEIGRIENLPLNFIDNQYSLSKILCSMQNAVDNGTKIIFIDYLGLISVDKKFQRNDLEIGYITKKFKEFAKINSVPIVLLSQLKRPQEGARVLPPTLSDLRNSGDIEQDADVVIFPHRTSYYLLKNDPEFERLNGKGALIIAKNRDGERNTEVVFYHDKRFKKIWGDEENTQFQNAPY